MDSKSTWETVDVRGIASFKSVATLVGVWFLYRILVALYNISPFHPLSRFPGPKIAAVSYLYEAYYDWWRVGRYGKVIRDMHERYGRSNNLQMHLIISNTRRSYCQNQSRRTPLLRPILHRRNLRGSWPCSRQMAASTQHRRRWPCLSNGFLNCQP